MLVLFSSQNLQEYLQNEKHGNELYIDVPDIAFNLQIIEIGMVMIKFYNYHIKFLLLTMLEGACLSYVKASMVRYETYKKCETKLNGGYLTFQVWKLVWDSTTCKTKLFIYFVLHGRTRPEF